MNGNLLLCVMSGRGGCGGDFCSFLWGFIFFVLVRGGHWRGRRDCKPLPLRLALYSCSSMVVYVSIVNKLERANGFILHGEKEGGGTFALAA